jgi:hypothetical protein
MNPMSSDVDPPTIERFLSDEEQVDIPFGTTIEEVLDRLGMDCLRPWQHWRDEVRYGTWIKGYAK